MDFVNKFKNRLLVGGSIFLGLNLIRWIANGKKASNPRKLLDKTIIVTGPTAGIGKETSLELLKNGANVIFACRDVKKAEAILEKLDQKLKCNAQIMYLDLGNMESVVNFAEKFKQIHNKLDILINNAGAMNLHYNKTQDDIELTIGVNHIGHVLLTDRLLDIVERSNGRIINVSSEAHRFAKIDYDSIKKLLQSNSLNLAYDFDKNNYGSLKSYTESKLGNVFFTVYLNNNLKNKNSKVKVASLHPGYVRSDFTREIRSFPYSIVFLLLYPIHYLFSRTEWYGAQTTLNLCYMEDENFSSGSYYDNCKVVKMLPDALNDEKRDLYMNYTKEIVKVFSKNRFTISL